MDSFRKQLDALMGANRNGDVEEVQRNYYDRDVCRLHLAGLCPHELFQLTKMDMGPCTKLHSLQLRKEYEAAKSKGKANFNQELEEVLGRLIGECDRKIVRALRRLEDDDAKAATAISVSKVSKTLEAEELTKQIKQKIKGIEYLDLEGKTDEKIRIMEEIELLRAKRADVQAQAILDAFNKDRASMPQPTTNPPTLAPLPTLAPPDARTQEIIQEKLKRAEELGELGMIDEAQKAMEEAEALRKLGARHEVVLDPAKIAAANVQITDQKLRVCDICGAFLSVYDSDRRLADHFGGKLHLGYMQIREKVDDIQEEEKNSRHRSDDDRYHDQNNSRERGMDRDRDRDRERNRERSHALESRRDRDNERGRDREYPDHSQHSRDIDRASERDRGGRDYYYHGHSSNPISSGRRRSPSKSRSRDRSQERSRDRDRSQERSRDWDRSEYYRRQQRY